MNNMIKAILETRKRAIEQMKAGNAIIDNVRAYGDSATTV